jgi:hypothetical protein
MGCDRRSVVHRENGLAQDSAGRAEEAVPSSAVAQPPSAVANLLSLQSMIGNRALARAIQEQRVLARAATGLRRSKKVTEFADDALKWWRDPANKDKPLEDYATHLMTKVNAMLKALNAYESKYVIDHAGSASGTFGRVTWTITINPDKFSDRQHVTKVGQLTADEAAEIADTIYHESRHCEQYFRIARVQAGRMKKGAKDPGAKIAKDMSIPRDVADAAAKAPLKATDANAGFIAEAEDWESITVGRHAEYKGIVNTWGDEADALDDEIGGVTAATVDAVKAKVESTLKGWKASNTRQKFVKSHLATTRKIKKKTTVDDRVVRYLTDIQARLAALNTAAAAAFKGWDKTGAAKKLQLLQGLSAKSRPLYHALYEAYKGHIHEEDAWATGGAVGKKFRREQKQLVAAEKAAAAKKAAEEKAKKDAARAKRKARRAAKAKKQAAPVAVAVGVLDEDLDEAIA